MAIELTNCTILGINYRSEFLADIFRIQRIKEINLEGMVLGDNFQDVESDAEALLTGIIDYQQINVNGINVGTGRFTSFNLQTTNEVNKKPYTASIEVFESGDYSSISSNYYNNLSYTNYEKIIEFTEDFNYENNENRHIYNHNINLQLISGGGNPITLAKTIALNLFQNTDLTGFIGGFDSLNKKKYYIENYDIETNRYSWQESVEFLGDSGNYSHDYTIQAQTNEDGITNVSENGNIKGIIVPIYQSAIDALNVQKPLISGRITDVFNTYIPAAAGPLFPQPIVQSYNINKFEGLINYNLTYTNSPLYTGNFSWEYTNLLDKDANGVYNATENGEVIGIGRKREDKFTNAYNGYVTITGGINTRLSNFFSGFGITGALITINRSTNKDHIEGRIGYSETKSTNESLGNGTFKQFELTVNDTYPTYLVNEFGIIGHKSILQPVSGLSVLLQRNINVDAIGTRTGTLDTMLDQSKIRLSNYTGFRDSSYLSNVNYSLNRKQNRFNLSLTIVGIDEPPTFGQTTI